MDILRRLGRVVVAHAFNPSIWKKCYTENPDMKKQRRKEEEIEEEEKAVYYFKMHGLNHWDTKMSNTAFRVLEK